MPLGDVRSLDRFTDVLEISLRMGVGVFFSHLARCSGHLARGTSPIAPCTLPVALIHEEAGALVYYNLHILYGKPGFILFARAIFIRNVWVACRNIDHVHQIFLHTVSDFNACGEIGDASFDRSYRDTVAAIEMNANPLSNQFVHRWPLNVETEKYTPSIRLANANGHLDLARRHREPPIPVHLYSRPPCDFSQRRFLSSC